MKTIDELIKQSNSFICEYGEVLLIEDAKQLAIDISKMHVERALKEALKQARINQTLERHVGRYFFEAYPLENIK